MKKGLTLLPTTRRTRSSEKNNPQVATCGPAARVATDATADADVDLYTLYSSGCVTRGQISRVKKIIDECAPSTISEGLAMSTRSSKRLASENNLYEKMQVDSAADNRKVKSMVICQILSAKKIIISSRKVIYIAQFSIKMYFLLSISIVMHN